MRRFVIICGLLCLAPVPALAQGKDAKDAKDAPLYSIDTDAVPAPPAKSALARILKRHVLRVCVRADAPPFGYFARKGLTGFDVHLAMELAKQISIDYKAVLSVSWNPTPAGDRVGRLRRNACDISVSALSWTRGRAGQIGLSKAYAQTDKVLVAAEQPRAKAVIGLVKGTTGGTGGVKAAKRWFNTWNEVLFAMRNGGIDYTVSDRPIAIHLTRSTSKAYKVSKVLAKNAEKYVVGVKKGNKHLLKAVNKALTDLAQSGRLAYLQRRWL